MYMDLPELDRLKTILFHASSESDESVYVLKRLLGELDADMVFLSLDNTDTVRGNISEAMQSMHRIRDVLYDLGKTVSFAHDSCLAGEAARSEQIEKAAIAGKEVDG